MRIKTLKEAQEILNNAVLKAFEESGLTLAQIEHRHVAADYQKCHLPEKEEDGSMVFTYQFRIDYLTEHRSRSEAKEISLKVYETKDSHKKRKESKKSGKTN